MVLEQEISDKERMLKSPGDRPFLVGITMGSPVSAAGTTNLIKVQRLGG